MSLERSPASAASRRPRTKDAATYVGVSSSMLEKLRVTGGGPRYLKPGGKLVIYDTADLDTWLEASARNSTSEPVAA